MKTKWNCWHTLRIFVTLLCIVAFSRIFTEANLTTDQRAAIDEMVQGVMACRRIPGLTLSMVRGNTVLLQKGYGLIDMKSGRNVTSRTLFPIGSTTKAFTATVLAKVIDSSKSSLTWDTPIVKILGDDFKLYDDILTTQTSLRDLLSHRTGLPSYMTAMVAGYHPNVTRLELVSGLRHYKPKLPFRSSMLYNNILYMLAGYVAERLYGKSWEVMVKELLLEPLGMKSTTYIGSHPPSADVAQSYTVFNGTLRMVDKILLEQVTVAGPAGSMLSNAEDVAKWIQFHLSGGKNAQGEQLVPKYILQDTYMPTSPNVYPRNLRDQTKSTFPVSDVGLSYNLAWMTNVYRGYKRLGHSGGITSYKTQIWFYPEENVGLFVSVSGPLGTGGSNGVYAIAQYLSDILLGETPWLTVATACSYPAPWVNATQAAPNKTQDDSPPGDIGTYEGIYHHPAMGNINITYNNDDKHLHLYMGRFLESVLYYDNSSNIFNKINTGLYWFYPDFVPVKFEKSKRGSTWEKLLMAMDSPAAENEPVPFVKKGLSNAGTSILYNVFLVTLIFTWILVI